MTDSRHLASASAAVGLELPEILFAALLLLGVAVVGLLCWVLPAFRKGRETLRGVDDVLDAAAREREGLRHREEVLGGPVGDASHRADARRQGSG